MEAGSLRHQITIQQKSTSRDAIGGVIDVWTTFVTVRAAVEPIRGREYFAAQQVHAEVSHRIRMRYRAGITPRMQVTLGSRTFQIETVINVQEQDRELHLMVVEVVS